MPRKANGGYICPKPSDYTYTISKHVKGKERDFEPSGVFVSGNHAVGYTLEYAGLDTPIILGNFQLPHDPSFLREIAAALEIIADDLEEHQLGR